MNSTLELRPAGKSVASRTGVLLAVVAMLLGLLTGRAAAADPTNPATDIAKTATPQASYTAPWNSLSAINDGAVGTGLNQMWGSYADDRPAQAWVSYHWDTPVTIGKSVINFWSDAPQAGTGDNVWAPKAWKLQYKSAGTADWTDVPGTDSYGVSTQVDNTTTFPALTVTDVRALLDAYPNADASQYSALSVPEWQIWGTSDGTTPTSPSDPVAVDEVDVPTTVGAIPTLPSSVGTTAKDGHRVQVAVTWPAITADQVAQTGSFTVTGTPSGIGNAVVATVYVRAAGATPCITGFLPVSALTVVGVAPELPTTVPVTYDDDSVDSSIPVTWTAATPADYATTGLFTLTGSVAGTDLRPEISVFVDEPAIDGSAPIVALSVQPVQPATGWYTTPVTVNIAASSDSDPNPTVEYRVDGGGWTAGASVVVSADGAHTVTARATDQAGHVSAERSATFSVDATAPVTTVVTDDRADAVQVTLTAQDAGSGTATIQYQVGDGFVATYAGSPITVPKLDKSQTVRYFATDKAGNIESVQTFEVPAAAPVSGATTTAVTLSESQVAIGRRASAMVTVTGATGTPTGIVVLRSGATELGRVALVDGKARMRISTVSLKPGDIPLTVDYLGEGANAPSSASAVLTLTQAASQTRADVSQTTVEYGAGATVRVYVSAPGVTPGGSIGVAEGTNVLAIGTLVAGRAVVQVAGLTPGVHTLQIYYSGEDRVSASVAETTLTVTPASTSVALAVSPNPLTALAQPTATVSVTSSVSGLIPSGTVQVRVYKDGRAVLSRTRVLSVGRVGLVLPKLAAGTYTMTATYSGSDVTRPASTTIVVPVTAG